MKTKDTAKGKTAEGKAGGWVFLKRDGAGGWRAKWYGRFMRNGKTRETSLCDWQGTPPANPAKEEGNAAFERSRERARKMLADSMGKWNEGDAELRDARKVYAIMYGRRVDRVKIADLWERWDALPHRADMTGERRARVRSILRRFADFMGAHFPNVTEAGALTADHFKAFLDNVDAQGFSARSWNDHLSILRSVLGKVDGQGAGFREYLAILPKRQEAATHRRPFSGEELEAVFDAAARIDPDLRPVIVTAACTALRRGDAATLKWESVDLADGFITVKTAKTGETVEIPIFGPLADVLADAAAKRRAGVPYVFPKIALAYKAEPSELNRRLRKVLAGAGFTHADSGKTGGKFPAPSSPADAEAMVLAGMRAARWTDKRRDKGLEILRRHLQGQDGRTIARELGIGKSSVSEYLHAMEEAGKIALVSPPKTDAQAKPMLADFREGEQRIHRGSLCGWHSFRTTFCSLALAAGIPMELLRRITGHRTAAIVEKHYNQAKREEARRAFGAAMPAAIAGASREGARTLAAPSSARDAEEFVALPAPLAGLLAGASPEELEKVAAILKKGGRK